MNPQKPPIEDYHQLKELLSELAQAKIDLDCSHSQFNEVAEPAAVDEVIYRMNAAESKFDRLLQRAKFYGVRDKDLADIGIREGVFGGIGIHDGTFRGSSGTIL